MGKKKKQLIYGLIAGVLLLFVVLFLFWLKNDNISKSPSVEENISIGGEGSGGLINVDQINSR